MHRDLRERLTKIASILTLITFIFTNITYAAPSRSLFKDKKVDYKKLSTQQENRLDKKKSILGGEDTQKLEERKKETQRVLSSHLEDLSQIHIPSELGRVTDVYESPKEDARLIVHIQDLHTNPEAELNLAKILEILLKDYNMGLVCSEGADGEVDTSSVASFPDYEVREKTARLFINSGELTGEEYLSITKYPDLPIWGIEDRDIYFQNIIDFNKIMKFSPSPQVFISQAQKALDQLKSKIYSKELSAIDQKEVDYENEKIETDEFLKCLTSYIEKFNIPTDNYKNISLLTEAAEEESRIDQLKVMQESQNLLLNLQAVLSGKKNLRKDKDDLMVKAKLFKEQKISPFSFYSYLKDLALKHSVITAIEQDVIASVAKQSKYPNLNTFLSYLTKVNSLDSTKLFTEMESLAYEVKMRLAKTEEEKSFIQALRNIKFLEGFFNLKVSNEELDYYLANRDSHKVGFFKSFLAPALKKYKISSFIDYNPSLIDTHLNELEVFYDVVKERDISMVRNSLSEIEKRNIKVASLIAGGFHTKGITKLLRDKGYSYIVVSPYSSTDIDEANYHFLLSGKRKPIEEILKQLDLPEIVNRLSTSLRIPLALDVDIVDAFNKEVAPRLSEILETSVDNVKIEHLLNRIAAALALGRGANVWDDFQGAIVIKSPEKGVLYVQLKPEQGDTIYLKVTPIEVYRIKSNDFKGKTVANIVPKDKTIEDTIEYTINRHTFLRENIPTALIDRIRRDEANQRMVKNVLGMLVSHYEWVMEDYVNRSERTEDRKEIISELQEDIYKPIIGCLDRISKRIENGGLIPNAVTLKLSEKSEDKPKVNIGRKVKISYLPMKGDPWQIGHIWSILDLLADDSDIVVIMMDNSDPDRKPDLTALPIREADSQYLFDSLAPFVVYTEFQRERHSLLTVDGETTVPTLIYENRGISDQVIWQYIAGYDHFNWTNERDGKTLLDVPNKLSIDLTKLIGGGVPVQLIARFNKRGGDSEDSPQQRDDKIKVIEALAKVSIIEHYAVSTTSYATETYEGDSATVIKAIDEWRKSQLTEALSSLNQDQKAQFEDFNLKGKAALNLGNPVNVDVKAWFDRFKPATAWLKDDRFTDLQLRELEGALAENEQQALIRVLTGFLNNTVMSFKVVDQPMDTSSTDVRKNGRLHTVLLDFAHSIIGLRRYPAFADDDTKQSDRKIATDIIALLIDLRSFGEIGKLEKEVLEKHLGKNLSNYVDVEALLEKINQRLSIGQVKSIIFSEDNGREQVGKLLANAYGNALNAVDGYLMNFILKDDIFKLLLSTTGMDEKKAIEFINGVRDDLIRQRASEIVIKSREEQLALKKSNVFVEQKGAPLQLLEYLVQNEYFEVDGKDISLADLTKNRINPDTEKSYVDSTIRLEIKSLEALGLLKTDDKGNYTLTKKLTLNQVLQIHERAKNIVNSKGIEGEDLGLDRYRLDDLGEEKIGAIKDVVKGVTGEIADEIAQRELLLQRAVAGESDAYQAIKDIPSEQLIAYFNKNLNNTIENLPEDLFGYGFGYDIRGTAQPLKGAIVNITPANYFLIGKLLGSLYANVGDTVLVTGDTRHHTPILRYSLALGYASVGVNANFSEEGLTSGAHNVYSADNSNGYKHQVQVSGSHGVPEKNGAKIKVDFGGGLLEPLYADKLLRLYTEKGNFRKVDILGSIDEVSGIRDAVAEMYNKTLPQLTKPEIFVLDCKAGAAGPFVDKFLGEKRGFKIVDVDKVGKENIVSYVNELWKNGNTQIAIMLNMHPDAKMLRGIWDPSKPEALVETRGLVKELNEKLTSPGMPKVIGGVFDGDADRMTAIVEDAEAISAFEMTLPFYQRFLLDPKNKAAIIEITKAGGEPLLLACDVRSNDKLSILIDNINKMFQGETGIKDKDFIKGYMINTGYPPQLSFVKWRIEEMDKFVNINLSLKGNEAFMQNYENLKRSYYTAEASGHNFFQAAPGNSYRPCDDGLAAFTVLASIRETIGGTEAPILNMKEKEDYTLVELFDTFPTAFSSEEIRVLIPNSIKIATAHKLGAWLKETYEKDLFPNVPNGIIDKGEMLLQPKDDGFITVAGYKARFKDGRSALIRWSNTGEQLTLIFTGYDWDSCIEIINKVGERLEEENLDASDLKKEVKRLKQIRDSKNISAQFASRLFEVGIMQDPEGYGYIAFNEDGPDRAPRFGEPMDKAIDSIEHFQRRHYGDKPQDFNEPVIITGEGIGGQMTCSIPGLGYIVKYENREFIPCDSLGTNYKVIEDMKVAMLRRYPKAKALWAAGSKSGGTDETMINFQMNLKMETRVWSRVYFGDDLGVDIAENLLAKIFDSTPLFEKTLQGLNLDKDETKILQTVFKNLIVITGKWNDEKKKGSRLDRLIKEAFLNDLYEKDEDKVVSILMLDNLGGRFQGISPNAFVYDALLGMDIKEILRGAKEEAIEQREKGLDSKSAIAATKLLNNNTQQLAVVIPNDIIFGRLSEALSQLLPESLGKGRIAGTPFGIQTYPYDASVVNRVFKDIQSKGKAYFVIDIEGEESIKLDKDIEENNLIIRYKLKSISEYELGKLVQFVEHMTVKIGLTNTVKALLAAQAENKVLLGNIDIFNEANLVKIMQGPKTDDDNYEALQKLHEVFNNITPFRQPDVEYAKKLVQGGRGAAMFNGYNKTDGKGLPVRDDEERKQYYSENDLQVANGPILDMDTLGLRNTDGEFKSGQDAERILQDTTEGMNYSHRNILYNDRKEIVSIINVLKNLQDEILSSGAPLDTYKTMQRLKNKRNNFFGNIKSKALTVRLDDQEEATARHLASLILKAHREGKSLDFVLYEDRNPLTELLKLYVDYLGIDLFGFGPANQHKWFQRASGGIDVSTVVLIQSVKELLNAEKTQEEILFDGCVPDYLHKLYPSEVSELYLRAYSSRFKENEVQTESSVLMVKDAAIKENIADIMILFTRVMELYEQNRTTVQKNIPNIWDRLLLQNIASSV